jgi:hypothetical protein
MIWSIGKVILRNQTKEFKRSHPMKKSEQSSVHTLLRTRNGFLWKASSTRPDNRTWLVMTCSSSSALSFLISYILAAAMRRNRCIGLYPVASIFVRWSLPTPCRLPRELNWHRYRETSWSGQAGRIRLRSEWERRGKWIWIQSRSCRSRVSIYHPSF